MAKLLKGAPVAAALNEQTSADAAALRSAGIVPTLAILRVGEREDDLVYERNAVKRCEKTGVEVKTVALPADVESEIFFAALEDLNRDDSVHGILLFRPLPGHLDEERARSLLSPDKDVDGCTDASLAGVFTGADLGFPPCTARAVLELLRFYGVELRGKRVSVLGRSLVIGRPVAMLLLREDATVTLCHSRTADLPSLTREADILIAATGRMESIGRKHLREGQAVVDVGIGWNEEKQKLCGDVVFEEAESIVDSITPVPGGVGGVTTAVLCKHVVEAAMRRKKK